MLVVLDFDGTVTDAEVEGEPFTVGYLEDLAGLTGRPLDEIQGMAERFRSEVLADPQAYGWLWNGAIVAPATVDPYLRIMPVARKILDEVGAIPNEADRARLLDAILFKYNYRKTVTAFRPGAAELLAALQPLSPWVVTNAHTEPVRRKLVNLGEQHGDADRFTWLSSQVHGRANKQVIDADFAELPQSMQLPGLSRPVLLRRRHYVEVLRELKAERPWHEVLVVGDIFELDLSVPLELGCHVALASNDFTPDYEKTFVDRHERGHLFVGVDGIADLAQRLSRGSAGN